MENVKWMRKDAGGLICVAVDPVASKQLKLPFMAELVREASKTNDMLEGVVEKEGDLKYDSHSSFSLWVNHRETRTGIPDKERALTIRKIGETEKVYFFPSSFERSLARMTAFINAALTPASSRACIP